MKTAVLCALCFGSGVLIAVILAMTVFAPAQSLRFDIDNDGKLSFNEFRSSRAAIFELADENGDGSLTKNEIRELSRKAKGGLPSSIAAAVRFSRFDYNGDGIVSLNETRDPKEVRRIFDEHDRNSDGVMDANEVANTGLGVILIKK